MDLLVAPSGGTHRSIQEAINDASPGSVIRVSPGLYSRPVLINKPGLTLQAVEMNGECQISIKRGPVIAVCLQEGQSATIRGFKLIHNNDLIESEGGGWIKHLKVKSDMDCAMLVDGGNVVVEDCMLSLSRIKSPTPGLVVAKGHCTLKYCEIKGREERLSVGVLVYEASLEMMTCKVHKHGSGGLQTHNSLGVHVKECIFINNEGYGLNLSESEHSIVIEGCMITQNSGPGVLVNEKCTATLKGNEIKYNEVGVEVLMAFPRIEANKICYNFSDGLVFRSDNDTPCRGSVLDNEIFENENGITCTGLLCNPEISTNAKIGHNRKAGIRVQDYAVVKIYKNMIFENVHQGVLLTHGTSAHIYQNSIYGNLRANVAFGDGDVVVVENKIYNGRCEGIFMMNGRGVVKENEIYECNDGILSVSSKPEVEKNSIYHNRRTGVTLADKSKAFVHENQIHHNGECGLYVRDTSKAVIKGNSLHDNAIQISFTSSKKMNLKEFHSENEVEGEVQLPVYCLLL
mmetsp:Transcript_6692/g.11855  ORF Transcript_6692/g.11855 Transcript_6692/m.11855 type:complete len:516 (+) Transcript_6692:54-1601(+)